MINLVAEPTNNYDSNAVLCIFNGAKLGYIPKTMTAFVHADRIATAKIIVLNPTTKWKEITIEF